MGRFFIRSKLALKVSNDYSILKLVYLIFKLKLKMGKRLTEKSLREIEQKALQGDIKKIVSFLRDNLGFKLTAYLSGRFEAAVLDLWMSGKEKPNKTEELRLRYGYWAARLVIEEFGAETAKSLFLGMNGYLGDEAPASWLRDHEKEEDLKEVVTAIYSFLDGGFH